MGKRGPKRTPTAILRLRESNLVPRRPDADVEPERPECPEYVTGPALELWDELVELLFAARVITRRDRQALARYCVTWSRWRDAEAFLTEHGTTYEAETKRGTLVIQYPQVRQSQQWSQILIRLEAEFGLGPSSRSNIGGGTSKVSGDDLKSRLKKNG